MRRDSNGNEGDRRSAPRNVLGDQLTLFAKTRGRRTSQPGYTESSARSPRGRRRSFGRAARRSARACRRRVATIVKAQASAVGLEPAQYAAHSLRAGFCTSAASKGASLFKITDTTRHRSVDTLRGYVRDADLFANHAGAGLLYRGGWND
jgi:hypothetical protein